MFRILIQMIMAFLATLAFAVLFHVPKKEFFYCGITGAIGWFFYLLVRDYINSIILASFVASIVITVVSRFFAVNRKLPVTIFLISGILPLVPGAGIYYTAYYAFAHETTLAVAKGIEAFSIALAIAFGIMLIFFIPQKVFLWGSKWGKK
ncbi:MAG: threonine/serine exporter [Clostridiales bacterium]|nr:threonine/serine exporter [Clostridiales bacterium]